jgi:putative transposase
MLTDQQFNEYVAAHNLSSGAVEYIQEARSSEASRMVGVNAVSNVVSFVPSKKMGFTLSTESRGPERAFLLMSEYDERVLEIWDQPPPIQILRTDINGRRIKRWYTPDFLMLTTDGPIIVEVKSEHAIDVLAKRYPQDWIRHGERSVDYAPGVDAFKGVGIQFKVFVFSNELRFLVNNLDLMVRSRRNGSQIDLATLEQLFRKSFAWTLYDLREFLGLVSYADLIVLVDSRILHFDIKNDLLTEPKGCVVVRDVRLLAEAKSLLAHQKMTDPLSVDSVSFSKIPDEKYALDALEKIEKLKDGLESRSAFRWKSQIKKGQEIGLSAFQSLISKKYLSGNRCRRPDPRVINFLESHVADNHIGSQGKSTYRCYITYRVDAIAHHPDLPPVVWETYRSYVKQLPAGILAKGRGGQRAANKDAMPSDPAERNLKPDLPWRMAAIDHYTADIYLICFSDDGVVWIVRPILTAMIDLFSGEVLSFAVSFQAPSRKADCKVIRDCVRRHGKLPAEIIVDRGSDFKSVYFSSLMAHFGCIYTLRPTANPKFGSEIEGLFGEFKKQWLSQRKGNLADYKEARSVDGKVHPKKTAVLTPFDFYREFEAFCNWRSHKPRGISEESGFNRFNQVGDEFPFVAIPIELNDEFLLATAVESGDYTIDFQRGIHIGPLHYWSPKLSLLRGKKQSTEVRLDPENPHLIYTRINNTWEVCLSSHANRFSALDPISQRVEMLKVVESKNSKSLIARSADEDLVRKIRSMDFVSEGIARQSRMLEIPEVAEDQDFGPQDVFSTVLNSPVRSLSVDNW